jgi:histidinol-phosphate phosphatase family protein
MRPLTDRVPKHMIDFHGRPFLSYLVEMLASQGFERLLLLLGYLPEPTMDYFGDGSRFGIQIDYDVTPAEWQTSLRVRSAIPKLDDAFLLTYCDNLLPLRFLSAWQSFQASGCRAQITAYTNEDGYTRSNLKVADDGLVVLYDRPRREEGLNAVDVGFAILERDVLLMLPEANVPFESALYPALAARNQLNAFVTPHRYYTVGDPERLALTREFLARRPTILLDRDGVLNECPARGQYVRSWDEWKWLPGSLEALALFAEAGWRVLIVTNQAGVGRGVLPEKDLHQIHLRMLDEVCAAGGDIEAIYCCLHGWNDGCACRKPKPGLLFQAQKDFSLDLSRTWFVGDDERDARAAEAAGCPFMGVEWDRPLFVIARQLVGAAVRGETACVS